MDVTMLSRIQFAMNISFHYLFPPMSIGIAWVIVFLEAMYLKTKKQEYYSATRFFTNIFGLFFAMGVATGFVQLFAFGNNWSQFSKFVGNVFGSILAAEGIFAFFLEAGFLGIMIFGWNKVKPRTHFIATCLVSLGATMSATWIVAANSWMQTPDGYKIIGKGIHRRAVITDLWSVYFNPSFLTRLGHVLMGCFLLGIFLVISICAYYKLKGKHQFFTDKIFKSSIYIAFFALMVQLWSADSSARAVSRDQPTKFAAMEAVFEKKGTTSMAVIGLVDMKEEKVHGIHVPHLLSLLTYHDLNQSIPGLNNYPKKDWPHVPSVFYSYRMMIGAWSFMVLIALLGILFRKNLEKRRWFLWLSVFSVSLPYVANMSGWFTAEMGRQPWIVYNVMRTTDGVSRVISKTQVQASLLMFTILYAIMAFLFFYLLDRKIKKGPIFNEKDDKEGSQEYRDPFLELNQ